VDLLRDLWAVFAALSATKLLSSTIVAKLSEMEGRPWAEFGRIGKPITTHQLAHLLKPFKVSPGSVRPDVPGDGTKGYKRESFTDLWERYLQTGTTAQPKDLPLSAIFKLAHLDPMCQFGIGQTPRKPPLVPLCRMESLRLRKSQNN
jgi:Protein of unknown function (DUF3631)